MSTCDGAPRIVRKITRFARAGKCVGFGASGPAAQRQPVMKVVPRTGTDDATGSPVNYEELDQPTAIRRRRDVTIEAMRHSGVDMLDIPAFLRKQAD